MGGKQTREDAGTGPRIVFVSQMKSRWRGYLRCKHPMRLYGLLEECQPLVGGLLLISRALVGRTGAGEARG